MIENLVIGDNSLDFIQNTAVVVEEQQLRLEDTARVLGVQHLAERGRGRLNQTKFLNILFK